MAWFNLSSTDLELSSSQFWSITNAAQTGLNFNSDFTIACWVKFESAPSASAVLIGRVTTYNSDHSWTFSIAESAGTYTAGLATNLDGSGDGGVANQSKSFGSLTTGIWYHFAVTYIKSSGTAEFYLDGASLGTVGGGRTTIYTGGSPSVRIGAAVYDGSNAQNFFDGKIDDLRVWGRTLSDAEITNLYTNLATFDNGLSLIAWWKFDDTALDETANNNDLTANGGADYSSDVPFTYQAFAETAGAPVESMTETTTQPITASEVAGVPEENLRAGFGWGGQSKSSTTWSNQSKS